MSVGYKWFINVVSHINHKIKVCTSVLTKTELDLFYRNAIVGCLKVMWPSIIRNTLILRKRGYLKHVMYIMIIYIQSGFRATRISLLDKRTRDNRVDCSKVMRPSLLRNTMIMRKRNYLKHVMYIMIINIQSGFRAIRTSLLDKRTRERQHSRLFKGHVTISIEKYHDPQMKIF